MVRSFLFKTSDLANGACAVHEARLCNIFGRQFEAFLDENEVLPANGGPCSGRIAAMICRGKGDYRNNYLKSVGYHGKTIYGHYLKCV